MSWFRFGVVRGLIGFIIGSVILLLTKYYKLLEWLLPLTPFKTLVASSIFVAVYIFAALLAIILCGVQYSIGSRVAKSFGIEGKGLLICIIVGIAGSFFFILLSLLIVGTVYLLTPFTSSKVLALQSAVTITATSPVVLIEEIVYASLTYGVYKLFGWKVPEVVKYG